MKLEASAHPIQGLLDQIWGRGHTPRVVVDATAADVVVPDHVRLKWLTELPIDLDASYPLDIHFDATAIYADLAFSGVVMRCTLPWRRIKAVVDRDSKEAFFFPENFNSAENTEEAKPSRPALRVIKGGKSN